MPDIESMVQMLRELNPENRLIAMGAVMALKAQQSAAGEHGDEGGVING